MVLSSLLLKGILIGFAIAMPVGPIGLLCIRNSLVKGAKTGFMTGLGAAVADTIYGALAGFGLASIMGFLMDYKLFFQIVGGVFLCYLGLMTFLGKDVKIKEESNSRTLFQVFFYTFLLTLTNPMTLLSFIGIYAGLGFGIEESGYEAAILLTSGVFAGSACWWLLLSTGTALLKNKVSVSGLNWINRLSGSFLITFGVGAFMI